MELDEEEALVRAIELSRIEYENSQSVSVISQHCHFLSSFYLNSYDFSIGYDAFLGKNTINVCSSLLSQQGTK